MRFGLVLPVLVACGSRPPPVLPPYEELVKKVLVRFESTRPGDDQFPPMIGGLGGETYLSSDALLPPSGRWRSATFTLLKAQADATGKDIGFVFATVMNPDGGSVTVDIGTYCARPTNTLFFTCIVGAGDYDEWDGRSGTWDFGHNLTSWIE